MSLHDVKTISTPISTYALPSILDITVDFAAQ